MQTQEAIESRRNVRSFTDQLAAQSPAGHVAPEEIAAAIAFLATNAASYV